MTSQGDLLGGLKGLVWVQPRGPNTEVYPLACHDMGDITQPHGTVTSRYCPDPRRPGKYRPVYSSSEAPGRATGSLTTYLERTADWLEKIADGGCATPLYLNMWVDGRGNSFSSYTRGELHVALIEQESRTNTMMRESDPASEQTFTYSAEEVFKYFKLTRTEAPPAAGAQDGLDIAFGNLATCRASGGVAAYKCDEGIIGCSAIGAATANVMRTINEGVTWALCTADPFTTVSEDVISVACFPIDGSLMRYLVACGTTAAGAPAHVSYSDDGGLTWDIVNVGVTNGEFFQHSMSLWALDYTHVWCVTNLFNLFFSDDGGETWTEQTSAAADDLWCIHFVDEKYGLLGGATNTIYASEDGGVHWGVVTGPVAQAAVTVRSCCVINDRDMWIGYADGTLWYTIDGGATWAQRAFTVPGAASVNLVNDIQFENGYFGAVAVNWTDGSGDEWGALLRTVNGGTNWEVYLPPISFDAAAAPGYNGLWMCDRNKIWAVGDQISTVASIHLFSGSF